MWDIEILKPYHGGASKSDPIKTPAGVKFCNPTPLGLYNIKRGVTKTAKFDF